MTTFWFQFLEGLRIAFRAIVAHRLRAILTTLGIVIGIVAVTAMFTVINGLERGLDNSMAMLGNDVLYVDKFKWGSSPEEFRKFQSRPNLQENIAEAIGDRSRFVTAAAPVLQTGRSVSYRDRSLSGVFIQASTADFARVRDIDLTAGRFYSETDNRVARNV